MSPHPYKPRKWTGYVTDVSDDAFWAILGPNRNDRRDEIEAEFPLDIWPERQRDLLCAGRFISFPARRDGPKLYVIDKPRRTRNQIKRAKREAHALWLRLKWRETP